MRGVDKLIEAITGDGGQAIIDIVSLGICAALSL